MPVRPVRENATIISIQEITPAHFKQVLAALQVSVKVYGEGNKLILQCPICGDVESNYFDLGGGTYNCDNWIDDDTPCANIWHRRKGVDEDSEDVLFFEFVETLLQRTDNRKPSKNLQRARDHVEETLGVEFVERASNFEGVYRDRSGLWRAIVKLAPNKRKPQEFARQRPLYLGHYETELEAACVVNTYHEGYFKKPAFKMPEFELEDWTPIWCPEFCYLPWWIEKAFSELIGARREETTANEKITYWTDRKRAAATTSETTNANKKIDEWRVRKDAAAKRVHELEAACKSTEGLKLEN